jgi:hypothetical protein
MAIGYTNAPASIVSTREQRAASEVSCVTSTSVVCAAR